MSLPYVYTPRPGEYIMVSRDGPDQCLVATSAEERGHATSARVLPEEVPGVAAGIAAAMHEAAGLPAPVILERPRPRDLLVDGGSGEECVLIASSPGRSGNVPGVLLETRYPAGLRLTGDEPLRIALALVDAKAEAEAGPDPAEVGELAAELRRKGAGLTTTSVDDIAGAALRWMKQREADHG